MLWHITGNVTSTGASTVWDREDVRLNVRLRLLAENARKRREYQNVDDAMALAAKF